MSEIVKEKEVESEVVLESKKDVRKAFEENIKKGNKEMDSNTAPATYISLSDEKSRTLFEMDLVFIRQKGENEKFLEITFSEVQNVQGQDVAVRHVKEVRTKEEFDKLKDFFSNLSWD